MRRSSARAGLPPRPSGLRNRAGGPRRRGPSPVRGPRGSPVIDLADTAEECAFRERLRAWLGANAPSQPAPGPLADRHRFLLDWYRRLDDGGWTGLSWPTQYGGKGLGVMEESIFNIEIGRAEAPPGPSFGYIGRPLLHFGSEDQKRRYLPPMLASAELWCQGFSEPDAGSDLA